MGITVIWTTFGNLANFMKKITKVFSGCMAMFSNGTCLSQSGSSTAAILAKKHRKPFYVLARAYKFTNKTQIDSLTMNLAQTSQIEGKEFFHLKYDVIPNQYISLLVTEFGLMPPTTVPVIIREFEAEFSKMNYEEEC